MQGRHAFAASRGGSTALRKCAGIALGALLLALVSGCGGGRRDTTPPGFVQVTVQVQHVLNGINEPPIDATNGKTLHGLHRDTRVLVTAVAADQESGVARVTLDGEASWDCENFEEDTGQHLDAALTPVSDEVQNGTAAPGTPAARQAHFTRDVFDGRPNRLICPASDNAGEVTVWLSPEAINGAGLTTVAPTIELHYLGRPPS